MTRKLGREFMRLTQYPYLEPADQVLEKPQPPLVKTVAGETHLVLPLPTEIDAGEVNLTLPLQQAIERRVSLRRYSGEALSLAQLSYLLWSTQGVRRIQGTAATLRTVPSAGARHALETYLLVNRVNGLEPGLYRFLPLEHQLAVVNLAPDMAEQVTDACLKQKFVRESAVTFIWTAVPYRMTWRYSERGYRYLHLDAGHVCQNLYLAAEALDAGVCAIAAFQDERLNEVLGVDGEGEFAIYVATVGRKPG
ncbi:MAG TPA: SagB/ThcOx family dehydrogenase [Patescibacteria group bacterium]|nr:SagB/ThcOx family dehydrogenase [Patescibacteria group bacterium]